MSATDVTRPSTNRRIVVARRPVGAVTPDCFRLETVPVPELADGEALAAVRYLSIDPTIRGWISHDTYLPRCPSATWCAAVAPRWSWPPGATTCQWARRCSA